MPTALIIGDSHVDHSPMAAELKRLLEADGFTVTVGGVGGSTAKQWLTTNPVCRPKNDWCVDANTLPQRPDLLLVSLGSNDIANMALNKQRPEPIVADVVKLIARFAPKTSMWIGPPWFRDYGWYKNQYSKQLYDAARAADVPIFDSWSPTRAAVDAGSGDGVHLGAEGSKVWAAAVVKAAKKSFPWLALVAIAGAAAVAAVVISRRR